MKEKELERLQQLKKIEEELYMQKGLKTIAGIDEAEVRQMSYIYQASGYEL